MKKIITFIGIVCLAGSVMAVSPKIKQYVKVVTDEKQDALVVQASAAIGDVDSTLTTPAFVGQMLVGTDADSAVTVWVAIGTTTNDWVSIGIVSAP